MAEWREETTALAIELAGMVMEGIVSNKKKQTFHVSRIAGKLQRIIDKKMAAERKRSVNRHNWRARYRKMTLGTPRDREVEAFIEELLRSVDKE